MILHASSPRTASPVSVALVFLSIVAFIGGILLAFFGLFTGMVAAYPSAQLSDLELSLLAALSGLLLAALGGTLMAYASGQARTPLTGYVASLKTVLAISATPIIPALVLSAITSYLA